MELNISAVRLGYAVFPVWVYSPGLLAALKGKLRCTPSLFAGVAACHNRGLLMHWASLAWGIPFLCEKPQKCKTGNDQSGHCPFYIYGTNEEGDDLVKEQSIRNGPLGPSLSGESRGDFNRRLFRGISARNAADAV